jgi:hypothetical protein
MSGIVQGEWFAEVTYSRDIVTNWVPKKSHSPFMEKYYNILIFIHLVL